MKHVIEKSLANTSKVHPCSNNKTCYRKISSEYGQKSVLALIMKHVTESLVRIRSKGKDCANNETRYRKVALEQDNQTPVLALIMKHVIEKSCAFVLVLTIKTREKIAYEHMSNFTNILNVFAMLWYGANKNVVNKNVVSFLIRICFQYSLTFSQECFYFIINISWLTFGKGN